MKNSAFYYPRILTLSTLLFGIAHGLFGKSGEQSFEDALSQVNDRSPAQYDPLVTPVPEAASFDEISTLDLLRKLESWNPSLRMAAAQALGTRGDEALPVLLKATQAQSGAVRAGAANALAAIIQQKLGNWKEAYPEISDSREAQEMILEDNSELEETFIRLTRDPQLEVRVAALEGLEAMAPQTPEAARAVLALCGDEDDHLAQTAMMVLDKRFSVKALREETVVASLKKAMGSPMPRGRGHVVKTIQKLDEQSQRKFIPELLAHLAWQPRRDTMFGAGGQADSIRLLTKFEVRELVPMLPDLMFKTMRGPGLFMPCLESAKAFGRDAKVILPDLRAILSEQEKEGVRKMRDHDERMDKLRETIAYLEKQ